ncbi:MAG TPA: hypothetical protein VNO35_05780 [Steroidobacteraceae bacterium]|nr:hypothetical protein [Steroidobacteraceae bacterium]
MNGGTDEQKRGRTEPAVYASGARIQWMFNPERARQKMERLYPSPLIAAPLAA